MEEMKVTATTSAPSTTSSSTESYIWTTTTTTSSTTVTFQIFYDISFDQDISDDDISQSEEIIVETTEEFLSEGEVGDSVEILRNLSLNLPDNREALISRMSSQ